MGAKSATEAYGFLLALLRSTRGLEWVADQVEEEITQGKPVSEKLSVIETPSISNNDAERQRKRPGKKAEFFGQLEYSEIEKFDIIFRAIQTVVLGGVMIQDKLIRDLQNYSQARSSDSVVAVEFRSIKDDDGGYRIQVAEITDRIEKLAKLLNELQAEVAGAD